MLHGIEYFYVIQVSNKTIWTIDRVLLPIQVRMYLGVTAKKGNSTLHRYGTLEDAV